MKKIDYSKIIPRFITILIAKVLLLLMRIDKKYDIILFNELQKFIEYNETKNR